MNLEITKKICIEDGGKVIAAYDVCQIERAIVDGEESQNLFITMKQGGYYNLVKVYPTGSVKETSFENCKGITEFDKDGVAGIMFCERRLGSPFYFNYIDTDLNLLFENKYREIEKVSNGMYIVAIDNIVKEGVNFKHKKLYGVITEGGSEVLECQYSSIRYNEKTDTFDTTL